MSLAVSEIMALCLLKKFIRCSPTMRQALNASELLVWSYLIQYHICYGTKEKLHGWRTGLHWLMACHCPPASQWHVSLDYDKCWPATRQMQGQQCNVLEGQMWQSTEPACSDFEQQWALLDEASFGAYPDHVFHLQDDMDKDKNRERNKATFPMDVEYRALMRPLVPNYWR